MVKWDDSVRCNLSRNAQLTAVVVVVIKNNLRLRDNVHIIYTIHSIHRLFAIILLFTNLWKFMQF